MFMLLARVCVTMVPPEVDVFVRSAVECRVFLIFFVYFAFSTFTFSACHALLPYSRQALLEIDSTHSLSDFTGSIPPELQHIIRHRGHHRQSREAPETPGSSELADPKVARRRRRHKRGKRGGLHARLKAYAS